MARSSTILIFILIISLLGCSENKIQKKYDYDKDGMILIDGKRTFIIGSYYLPKSETPYADLSKNGFNYVRLSAEQTELEKAKKNNILGWISLGVINEESETKDSERLSKIIKEFKDNPAILCWEIADEPAYTWNSAEPRIKPEPMKKTYDFIKQLDSEHLIFTNHAPVNLISTMQKYNNSTDVVAVDVYPVVPHGITPTYALLKDGMQGDLLNPYISQVGEYVDKMKKVVNNSKPIFTVLQGFAWEMLKPVKERTDAMIKYPTYNESRFMAYNAIVHGANGILYWGWGYTPQPSEFMDNLYKVTSELSKMQNILSSKTISMNIKKSYHELGNSVDTGVETILKKAEGNYYLISVNSDKNRVKVTLEGLQNYSGATVLKENRSLQIENGNLTDTFEPFDVHIYKLH